MRFKKDKRKEEGNIQLLILELSFGQFELVTEIGYLNHL